MLSILLLSSSCNSNTETNNQVVLGQEAFRKLDTLVTISGSWVSESYYQVLKNSKSPRAAQNAPATSYIVIPEKTLEKTFMVYNFHEGSEIMKVVKRNSGYELWGYSDENDLLTKQISTIEIVSKNKIKIDNIVFEKISAVDTYANDYIIEEILFRGLYKNSQGSNVEFTGDGKITGMDNFHFYKPMIDYFDQGMNIDQVYLGNKPEISFELSDRYGFRFSGDTLDLYKLNCAEFDSTSNNCGVVEFGERIDRLVKENK